MCVLIQPSEWPLGGGPTMAPMLAAYLCWWNWFKGGDCRSHRIEAYGAVIHAASNAQVDITLVELAERLGRDHGLCVAPNTVWRFLKRHDITVKKSAHASEQDPPDVAERRQDWFDGQPDLDPETLVFIDETGASTKMARLRGRAKRGERCRAAVPHGHWKNTTFTVALRLSGISAPMVLDGPMAAARAANASHGEHTCDTVRLARSLEPARL